MSDLIWVVLLFLLVPFALVPLLGAPYVPSRREELVPLLKKLGVSADDTLVDMGSGDGTILKLVSSELDMRTIGVELNPFLVVASKLRLFRIRDKATVRFGDMWSYVIPKDADVIYLFLLPKHMARMHKKIETEISKKTIVISYSFPIEGVELKLRSNGFMAYEISPLAKK